LEAKRREGVSSYISAFVLIGIAVGGSAVVLGAVTTYTSALGGPAVSIEGVGIRQGAFFAFERLTVFNSGQTPITSFTVSNYMISTSAAYCYSLVNPASGAQLFTTCPGMTTNPSAVSVSYALPPGTAVAVEITVQGAGFTVGSYGTLTVTTASGAQQTVGVQVAPA